MRVPGWEEVLAEEIEAARHRAFAWGEHDCALWAMTVRARLIGDKAPDWAGRYKTQLGAMRHLRKLGYASLLDAGVSILGDPLPNPLFARRGDVLLGGHAETCVGVCIGHQFVAPVEGVDGLAAYPLRSAALAWRV